MGVRFGAGIAELAATILLAVRATRAVGAAVAVGVLSGAVSAHLDGLGIEVRGDHGLFFVSACVALTASLVLLVLQRRELPLVGPHLP